jgi:hypothetical protein
VAGYKVDVGFFWMQGRHRDGRTRVPQRRRGLPERPDASERHSARRVAGTQIHLDRPHRVSRPRYRDHPQRDLGTLSCGQRNHACTNRWGARWRCGSSGTST